MLEKFSSPLDYGVSKNYLADELAKSRDLRSPGYLKLAEKELSYRLKILILVVLDSLALWLGWSAANVLDWRTLSLPIAEQEPKILSLFLTVLAFTIFLFFVSGLYRQGDKSRSISNSIKAVVLAHVAIIPIVLRFYGVDILYQLAAASLVTTLIVSSQRLTWNWVWFYIRQKHLPFRPKILLIGNQEELERSRSLLECSEVYQVAGQLDLSYFEDDESLHSALDRINYKELDEIFICSWEAVEGAASLYWKLRNIGINWRIIAINIKLPEREAEMATILGVPTIRFTNPTIVGLDFFSKRVFDAG